MYSAQARVALVHARMEMYKKRQRDDWIIKLGVLCCGFLILDMAAILAMGGQNSYHSPERWMYGASLLPSNIGSYVLVAIVAFVIAVAVTVVCMKKSEKIKQKEEEL